MNTTFISSRCLCRLAVVTPVCHDVLWSSTPRGKYDGFSHMFRAVHWQWCNCKLALVPVKWPWRVWVKSTDSKPQQDTTQSKLCAKYFFSVHDDVMKWKYFPRYWPFVREIHRSPVNFPHKGQWRGALMFTLICDRMNGWVNNHEAGDSRRYLAHCDVIVMLCVHNTWDVVWKTHWIRLTLRW